MATAADDPLKTTIATPAAPAVGTAGIQALTTPSTTGAATTTASAATTTPKASTGLAASLTAAASTDSVAEKVKALTSQDSPLMQQAKTEGLKQANRRGLLNSSMAVGATQDAMVRAALPIASQDATQEFQKGAQEREQVYQAGQTALDRANQVTMQGTDIASREKLAEKDRLNQIAMQDKEIGYQTAERKLDRVLQEQLASWNLKSSDRASAAQTMTQMQAAFQDSYSAIMANTNLDAAAREAQIVSARNLRDKNLGLVEQMYAIDLKWTDADFGITPAAAQAAPAPVAQAPAAAAPASTGLASGFNPQIVTGQLGY